MIVFISSNEILMKRYNVFQLRCLYLVNKLYSTRRVDFRSRFTMSSGLAFGFGNPASCMSSKANATLTTFSSKD